MPTTPTTDPLARLFRAVRDAARQHAQDTGEPDFEPGDLEVLFQEAYRLLDADQRLELWTADAVLDLLEVPEFNALVAPLIPEQPAAPFGVSPSREAWTRLPTGNVLAFENAGTNPEGTDYVRLVAPDGGECAYWTSDEWAEAPVEVMGALCGALIDVTRARTLNPAQYYQIAPDAAFPPGVPYTPYGAETPPPATNPEPTPDA